MATSKAKKQAESADHEKKRAKPAGTKGGSRKQTRAAKNVEKSKKTAKAAPTNGRNTEAPRAHQAAQDLPKDKRQLVQERKILNSQSRWLQKALFALSKAEDDQEKLAEVRGEKHEPMAVTVNGKTHELGAVTDSLRDAVMDRLEALRVTLRNEHALMG